MLLAPSSGLVRIGTHIAADRYSYMSHDGPGGAGRRRAWPVLGVTGSHAGGGPRDGRRRPRGDRGPGPPDAGPVPVLADLGETLWSHALQHGGESGQAHHGVGMELLKQGRLAEAEAHGLEAVRLDPGSPQAHTNLGLILARRGDLAKAADHYAEAIRLDPRAAQPHINLGLILERRGDLAAAAGHYAEAIRLDPERQRGARQPGIPPRPPG